MKNKEEILELLKKAKEEAILIAGGGVTGLAAAKLFLNSNYQVTIVDEKSLTEQTKIDISKGHFIENFQNNLENMAKLRSKKFSFALFSPGINPRSEFARCISELNIPIVTELDLALPFIGMPLVAVTGTNGKTTVVSLINEILSKSGFNSELVGNVGYSFLSKIDSLDLEHDLEFRKADWVAELSSYQLEGVSYLKPKISMLLNIDDDHLERHGNIEAYIDAKARIFNWQDPVTDWSILNCEESWAEKVKNTANGKILYFGFAHGKVGQGCYYDIKNNKIIFKLNENTEEYSLNKTKLLGKHNKLNLCASIAACRLLGVEKIKIQEVIDNFMPLEHRIEFVRKVKSVTYINDSKGTNVSAVMVALDTIDHEFPNAKITLLLGGKIKEGSWQNVERRLGSQVRSVVCFGADRELVAKRLNLQAKNFPVSFQENLELAVKYAEQISQENDVVILSPGCASFDAYTGFAQRGSHFKQLVNDLN